MIQTGTIQLPGGTSIGIGGTVFPGTWNLDANPGPTERSWLSPDIAFATPFSQPPRVVVSLAGVNANNASGPLRVRLGVENVQPEEFNIRVTVMEDTLLLDALVTWVAHDGA